MSNTKNINNSGFTIVELLVVIIVIGILAALAFVSYTNIQYKAQIALTLSDLSQNSKKIVSYSSATSSALSPLNVMSGGEAELKVNLDNYKIVTFCTNGSDFILAAETNNGSKFYTKNNGAVIQNDTIDSYNPCSSLSISSARTTYANLTRSTWCASENSTCNFSGTATIIYGYSAFGWFTAKPNMTSPVSCSNATFGDPASGYGKACYVVN